MPAVEEVAHTQLGTRPACRLADLAFCLISSQALEELHAALLREDAVTHFSWDGRRCAGKNDMQAPASTEPFVDISFADDLVLAFQAQKADAIVPKA